MDDGDKAGYLYDYVKSWIEKMKPFCEEDIYQSDEFIENGYEFIAECCNIVGYYDEDED